MDDSFKNNLFLVAIDYLFKEKMVGNQKELAQKIGITETSLSRIKKGQRVVSDDTLRKMNEAFNFIFNMQYFRGRSTKLLIEDVNYYEQHPEKDKLRDFDYILQQSESNETSKASESDEIPYSQIPLWAQQMAQKNEVLTQELRSLHHEIAALRITIDSLIKTLKS